MGQIESFVQVPTLGFKRELDWQNLQVSSPRERPAGVPGKLYWILLHMYLLFGDKRLGSKGLNPQSVSCLAYGWMQDAYDTCISHFPTVAFCSVGSASGDMWLFP